MQEYIHVQEKNMKKYVIIISMSDLGTFLKARVILACFRIK